jgi:glycerate kinase
MKVVCAPDSFKESLTAVQAADAMAAGVRLVAPQAEIDQCPIGDGGEGTLEALLESVTGDSIACSASGVFGQTISAEFALLNNGRIAFVEAAVAIGLAAIPAARRDLMRSSSFGVGELIMSALQQAPDEIIVGIGGSATNDGGCGMAQALGVKFYDAADHLITQPIAAAMLADIRRIDAAGCAANLQETRVIVAGDVDNPLTGPNGAARIFAAQKGASEQQVDELDDGLRHLADIIRRDLGIEIETVAGAGAAGGLGGGLIAFAGAQIVSGIETVLDAVRFESRVQDADLCLTGEGSLDAQTLSGKACIGVARAASAHNVITVALVGRVAAGASSVLEVGITEYVTIGEGLSIEQSMQRAAMLLTEAAAATTRKYR